MFRLAFFLAAMLPLWGVFWLLHAVGLFKEMGAPVVIGAIAYAILILAAYYLILDRVRPKSDFERVKLRLSQNGDTVLSVIPYGVRIGGRSDPSYRLYRARVRESDGNEVNHSLGVEATLFGGGAILDQRHCQRSLSDVANGVTPEPSVIGKPPRPSWTERG